MTTLALSPREMVADTVTAHRRYGAKAHAAFEDAASILGVSPRWVRAIYHGEPSLIPPRQAPSLRARFVAWLAADIEKTERLIAHRRALLAAMEAEHDGARGAGQTDQRAAVGAHRVPEVA